MNKRYSIKIFIFLICFVFFLATAFGAQVELSWIPKDENNTINYRVYYGTSSKNYLPPISVGNISTCTITELSYDQVYYFAVTAIDADGNESEYSCEVSHKIPGFIHPLLNESEYLISNISVTSDRRYELSDAITDGSLCYTDRNYTFSNIPKFLLNSIYIKTANEDNCQKDNDFSLTIDVNQDVTVFVAHDNRSIPSWLNEFTDTGLDMNTDFPMSIYSKEYPAGSIILGPNGYGSMYSVIIKKGVSCELPFSEPTLVWEPSVSGGMVSGYHVYYGVAPDNMTLINDLDNFTTEFYINSLLLRPFQTYFFAVTAYNSVGESELSNIVSFNLKGTTSPLPPTQLTVDYWF